jgi:hypothetical protein
VCVCSCVLMAGITRKTNNGIDDCVCRIIGAEAPRIDYYSIVVQSFNRRRSSWCCHWSVMRSWLLKPTQLLRGCTWLLAVRRSSGVGYLGAEKENRATAAAPAAPVLQTTWPNRPADALLENNKEQPGAETRSSRRKTHKRQIFVYWSFFLYSPTSLPRFHVQEKIP